jgi:ABC transport system ATP-binding/permease protein
LAPPVAWSVVILVDAQDVACARPDKVLFSGLSLTVSTGDRIGVVGINGTGKSTLLRVLAGSQQPEEGAVRRGRGVRIGMLDQTPELAPGTVRDAVGEEWRGEAMLDRLGMGSMLDADTSTLSGGQAKRVALARLLVHEHDLLILDEPTNHLDLDAVAALEEHLAGFSGGLLLVTHDRHVLDRVTTAVLELDRGRGYLHVAKGVHGGSGYAAYLDGRAEREEQAATTEDVRRNLARKELVWLRRGAPARTSKPKARIAAATAIVEGRAERAARDGDIGLGLGSTRLGSKGVELHGVGFSWPDGTKVLDPIDHALDPGDRLGIVGPNGAGKTTLLDLIAGRLTPTVGSVERGRTVKLGYHDQLGRTLDPSKRVRDLVAGDAAEPSWEQVRLMERFWFGADAQWAPAGLLSGGERRRLQLLLTLVEQPNVLMLDEPTNDLDLDTLRALEDFLDDWPGIVVVVSHDRAFLDRTVTEVLALDGSGGARIVRGGVAGWLAERAAKSAPAKPASAKAPSAKAPAVGRQAAPAPKPARSGGGRSPSTLRRLINEAERAMAAATDRRDSLLHDLAAAGSDHEQLAKVGAELGRAEEAIAAAEEHWLALGEEAESLGLVL